MEGDGSQPTQATQNVIDPRRIGGQNSGFSDEDISEIICLLHPQSDYARREVSRIARDHSQHVVGRDQADAVEPDYEKEDRAEKFALTPPHSDYVIILRLSAQTKDPLQGFQFGRNLARCDVCFANDPHRRLSNVHFRIYVNRYGVVMLEDSSTNGTFVDGTLLRAKSKPPNDKCDVRRVLSHGSRVKVLMHAEERDLEFLVRIPKRDGEYDRAYVAKLEEYWTKLDDLRNKQAETITPGPGGHVDLFNNAPRRPPNAPPRRIALPPGRTQDNSDRFPREWDGSGKYNRVGQIGKGAFAVVYKVTSKFDGNPYAAKELEKRRFIKNGVLDQKVENEMKIMQRLQHPNIVRYIEHFDWDNRLLIIIMEFVGGGDLGKLINNRGPLQEKSVKQMASQLLSAMSHLHENNITHRDIKPDNILIQSLGPFDVKLTDFGLSKMVDNNETFLRTFCGTLLYCAPEVYSEYAEYDDQGRRHPRNRVKRAAAGQRYDHAVDVWSLGGVLFYALTGSPPYPVRNGASYSELLNTIMTRPLNTRPLAEANISQEGIEFLRLMLEKRPESRATVKALQSHSWLGAYRVKSEPSFVEPIHVQSFDEVTDEEEELQINASQLSLQDGQSRTLVDTEPPFADVVIDDDIDNIADDFIEEDSEFENGTFGPPGQAGQRLFGEVNVSAVGSSGVIPEDRLNLDDSDVLGNESFGTEIRDSYESEDASTIIQHPASGARLSESALNGQSADQLHSLVQNVASQSLGATEADFQTKSAATSHANGTFKRKPPSVDTSDEFEPRPREKPTFKRLKSEGNLDALAEKEMDEYKLLVSVPRIHRLESGRQIDKPVHKSCFWGSDLTTWHLRYPEMTQLQYDMFQQAARSRDETFEPGKSPLWELAFKYFPPSDDVPAMQVNEPSTINDTKTMLKRDDSRPLDATEWDIPATAPPPEEDSLPDTLPPETQHRIVPVHEDKRPKRAIAALESSPGSVVTGISVPVTGLVMSWGRGPENTVVYSPKTEIKVPKYAAKLMLWKEGFDSNKWHKTSPWEKDENGEGYAFYLSTKATNGVLLNQHQLPSHDCKNPLSASRNWIPIYNGDEIVVWPVWGLPTDTSQTKVTFRCFWGDSAKTRPADRPLRLVPSATARKIDDACARAEKNARHAKQRLAKMDEANKDYEERKENIEKERERSRLFEERRLEASRYVAARNASRRGSPASAPATTARRGQTPIQGVPSPLQDSQSPPK